MFSFGSARFHGSTRTLGVSTAIVGAATTNDRSRLLARSAATAACSRSATRGSVGAQPEPGRAGRRHRGRPARRRLLDRLRRRRRERLRRAAHRRRGDVRPGTPHPSTVAIASSTRGGYWLAQGEAPRVVDAGRRPVPRVHARPRVRQRRRLPGRQRGRHLPRRLPVRPVTWNAAAELAGRPDLVGVDPAAAAPADQDLLAITLYHARGSAPWGGRCAGPSPNLRPRGPHRGLSGQVRGRGDGSPEVPYRFGWIPNARSPDLAIGSYSERGPWVVDPDAMPWRSDVARRRAQARAEFPRWLQARARCRRLGRVARVVGRVGGALGGWYVTDRRRGTEASRRGLSRRLRHAFAALGPTYIKLGQIISGGEGLFPPELVAEFKLLRDRVPPEPFDVVRRVVELDLGRSLDDVFERFDRTPIAAASIAQVHGGAAAHRRRGRRQGAATAGRAASCTTTSARCRGSRRAWSGASRSPRSRTRPRWWSCSRRRSSRSSTSASRRRTCSTSRACSPRPTSAPRSCPARTRRSSRVACS